MEFLSFRVLAIGAHYDDVELGCAGTLLKHVQAGDEVMIAVTSADEDATGLPCDRYAEQLCVMQKMGIEGLTRFNGLDPISMCVQKLDSFGANVVYAQYGLDTHQDHVRSSMIGNAVSRMKNIQLLQYNSGSAIDFLPTAFSPVDGEKKRQLLLTYATQLERRSIDLASLEGRQRYWGSLIGVMCAEAFVVRRMIWRY